MAGRALALGKGLVAHLKDGGQLLMTATAAHRQFVAQQGLILTGMGAVTMQTLALGHRLMGMALAKRLLLLTVALIAKLGALAVEQTSEPGGVGAMTGQAVLLLQGGVNHPAPKKSAVMAINTLLSGLGRGGGTEQEKQQPFSVSTHHHSCCPP